MNLVIDSNQTRDYQIIIESIKYFNSQRKNYRGDDLYIFSNVEWSEYENLLEKIGDTSWCRISCLEGLLEIMAPGRKHERIKELTGRLIIAYCDAKEIDYFSFGSTTLKNKINFNVIAVLTEDSLDYADEIFNFFLDHGITDVGLNMEETEGIHSSSSLEGNGIVERYRTFIQRFWELAAQTDGVFKVREFEVICSLIYDNLRQEKTEMNHPFAIANFDYQGNFSTFDPELLAVKTECYGDFILGNVLEDTLKSVCYTEKFQHIYRDMTQGVDLCRNSCEYFGVCGGGSGSNKFWENGSFASAATNACKYRIKLMTDIVLAELENSLGI